MSMGNFSNYADTVTQDFITRTCPENFAALIDVLEKNGISLSELGRANHDSNFDFLELNEELNTGQEDYDKIGEVYQELCKDFEKKTGLRLFIDFHESDDRGDEVDGEFWCVENVYILSDAGKKYEDEIERKFWTEFG